MALSVEEVCRVFTIDPQSAVPASEQLRTQVVEGVRDGSLPPGSTLPTVRGLAAELGLAPNTVAKTYRSLEQEGWVLTAGRRGTVVADQDAEVSSTARRRAEALVAELRALGLTPGETLRVVRQALDDPSS